MLAAGLCALLACARTTVVAPRDVILITLDTTRADALGCYGAPGDPTPQLDRLAREGARFEAAQSTSALTPVAHAAILTGVARARHGLHVMAGPGGCRLAEDVPTLAEALRAAGRTTIAVHSAFPVAAHFGFARGFDVFDSFDPARAAQGRSVIELQRRSDDTTRRVIEKLVQHPEPSFLWVHYWDPHDPVLAPPKAELPADLPRNKHGALLPSAQLYRAEVRYLDQQIGKLLAALENMGRYEDALIVVVADHGEGLGDHGWWHHRTLYQEQMRVPLIVRPPRGARRGKAPRAVPAAVSSMDITPTVLDYLDWKPAQRLDGQSLRGWIEGEAQQARAQFAEQLNAFDENAKDIRVARPQDDHLYAVVEDGWKLLYRPHAPEKSELFDLARDPRETKNLIGAEGEQFVRLARRLAERGAWQVDPPLDRAFEQDPAAKAALAALGYAGVDGATETRAQKWAWTCPEHRQETWPARAACPMCGGAPLLVGAP